MTNTIPIPADVPEFGPEWSALTALGVLTRPRFWPALHIPQGGPGNDLDLGGKHQERDLYGQLYTWLSDYKPGDCLLLLGPTGTGKTYLAHRILRHLVDQFIRQHGNIVPRFEVNIITEDVLMKGRRPGGAIDDVVFEHQFLRPNLLLLDDLGSSKHSDFTEGELFSLVDRRYGDLKTTIFTSNVPLADDILVNRIGARVADRINGMGEVILLEGESLRSDEVNPNKTVVPD